MGWLSREKKTGADGSAGEAGPPPPPPPAPGPVVAQAASPSGPMGRYGPIVVITAFDQAPVELTWQLPVVGELYRLVPGPDRPDYSVMVLNRPVHFYPGERFELSRVPADRRVPDRKGRPMVRVDALVVCSRFIGQQLHPGMKDLTVNVAYVIDDRVLTDDSLDLAAIEYAAVGLLSEGAAEPAPPADVDPERDRLLGEAAAILREGVEAQRGGRVGQLTATLALDAAGRLVGLTGVADGTAPEPTPDTFSRLNAVLAGLPAVAGRPVERLTVTVDGDSVTWVTEPPG